MEIIQWIYNGYFKAQDAFLSSESESSFDPEIIYRYIYYARKLSSHYSIESEHYNTLLCEYFLRRTFTHLINAIEDPNRSIIFRQTCLDSIHCLLFELRKHYQTLSDGVEKYLALRQQLQSIRI